MSANKTVRLMLISSLLGIVLLSLSAMSIYVLRLTFSENLVFTADERLYYHILINSAPIRKFPMPKTAESIEYAYDAGDGPKPSRQQVRIKLKQFTPEYKKMVLDYINGVLKPYKKASIQTNSRFKSYYVQLQSRDERRYYCYSHGLNRNTGLYEIELMESDACF